MMTLDVAKRKLSELVGNFDSDGLCMEAWDVVELHLSQPQPVAQGEAVAWQYRCITEEGPSPVWHIIDKETYDRWRETSWSRMEFRELFAIPTIPTGHRVVPEALTRPMCDVIAWHLEESRQGRLFFVQHVWEKLLAASPFAGGG